MPTVEHRYTSYLQEQMFECGEGLVVVRRDSLEQCEMGLE